MPESFGADGAAATPHCAAVLNPSSTAKQPNQLLIEFRVQVFRMLMSQASAILAARALVASGDVAEVSKRAPLGPAP